MTQKIIVDPVTRIEGHLKVEVEVDNGVVVDARCTGTMFRGLELIMQGRDPRDAQQIMIRICSVCPLAHSNAAALALDSAFGIEPPPNGRILRNLMFGSNYLQSHILHFFHLAALDYVKGPDVPPFVPRYQADYRLPDAINKAAVDRYLQALQMRRKAHEMLAIWSGRVPGMQGIVPGGATETVNAQKIIDFKFRLAELIDFVDNVYVPTVQAVAEAYADWFDIGRGPKNLLAFGGFPLEEGPDHVAKKKFFPSGVYIGGKDAPLDPDKVTEQVKYSWYADDIAKSPTEAVVKPEPTKPEAYSWLKAPRYAGHVMEVGPLARQWVMGTKEVRALGDKAFSVMGRHFARAIEASQIAHAMDEWVMQLQPGEPVATPYEIPKEERQGIGLVEGSRGALGHWHKIEGGRTAVYNAVVPTTWNCSPRDDLGQRGAVEQALLGVTVKDANNPVELVRIVRAFDPCLACAIHLMTPDKKEIAQFIVG
ncbi:MAG: nickel-dependent hydrogenase large subunit [Syntrophomonadaceae bacterium]|jgi:hydrogenase large subunit|nr:nickel-dependent hydrogenase large subunit [Syntrophomonadaceae bacterium]MDH7497572.1 nickel-dependent hydrogenase large subunit [Syntrophomonadaceae bacterium]